LITLTLNTLDPAVGDDGDMAKKPRTDRPRRRSFSPAEKPRLLAGYETATESGTGNMFLGENGLYSSLISEWRRTRDAGLLTGKPTGAVVGRPSADQAEIARLRRQLDVAERRLVRTEAALSIMGKAQALLAEISESADTPPTSRR
jgi:transposase-like protein